MKALLLIFTILFLSTTSFAKAKDSNVLKFDFAIYKKMTKKERSQYLKLFHELSVQLEKDKSRGTKSAFFDLQQLFMPYADAAKFMCFNGGMAYSVEGDSKAACNDQGPAGGDSTFSSCTGGGKRCSIALGLSADMKSGCWSSHKSATSDCEKAAGGADGLKRLEEQLNQCVTKTTTDKGIDCGKLTSAVASDTAELDAYCSSGAYQKTCNRVKNKVAKIRELAGGRAVNPDAPGLDVAADSSGCGPAEHKVLEDAFKKQTGKSIDPKWAALINLTEKGCKMGNYDLLKQMEKFGACSAGGGASLSDVQNSLYGDARPRLKSAVEKLKNGGAFNNEEIGQFKDYFGISPTEFSTLFCKSGSSKDFLINLEGMTGGASATKASDMVSYLLEGSDKAVAAVNRMPSGSTREGIKTYFTENTKAQGLKALFDNATKECNEGVALSCSKRTEYQSNYNAAKTDLAKKREAVVSSLIRVEGTFSNEVRGQKEMEQLKNNMATGYGDLETAYAQYSREKAANSGGMSAEGQKNRDRLKQCADEALTKGKINEGKASEEITAKSNFSGCHKRRLNALTTGQISTMFGSYYLKAKDGSKACYVADEKPFTKNSCTSKAAIKVSTGAAVAAGSSADRPEVCLEDVVNKYTAYEIFCNAAPTDSTGEPCTLMGGGDGTLQKNSAGDYSCKPGTVSHQVLYQYETVVAFL